MLYFIAWLSGLLQGIPIGAILCLMLILYAKKRAIRFALDNSRWSITDAEVWQDLNYRGPRTIFLGGASKEGTDGRQA